MKLSVPRWFINSAACLLLSPALAAAESDSNQVQTTVLAKDWEIKAEGKEELSFDLGNFAGKQIRLRLDGRIEWPELIGNTGAMTILVNGQPLAGRRLMNKPLAFTMREGSALTWTERDGNTYRLMYAPDFSDRVKTDETFLYGLPEPDQDPFHFLWDITPYVLTGKNTISIASPEGMELALKFRDIAVELGDPIPYKDPSGGEAKKVEPAPTGPLPVVLPKGAQPGPEHVEVSPGGDFRFQVNGRPFVVRSRTSLPEGQWTNGEEGSDTWIRLEREKAQVVTWKEADYEVDRRVVWQADHIAVTDTVRNPGKGLVGVMIENRLELPGQPRQTLLGGRETAWVKETSNPFHPTAMADLDGTVVGLVAENDVFRLHGVLLRGDQVIGLADRSLGLPPGGAQTLEWSIYAVPQGDYWDFVNAIRRNWQRNFTLVGPVTFTGTPQEWGANWATDLTVETMRAWLKARNNAVPMIMTHVPTDPSVSPNTATKERNFWHHGTSIPHAKHWRDNTRAAVRVMKEADPSVKVFAYIHPNLTTEVGHEGKYPDSVALEKDGTPAKSVYKPEPGLYLPTLGNSYGKALTEVYKHHVDELDANIYVDEITVAIPTEGPYPEWDGSTVVIDPATHTLKGKISNATLLMQPWLDGLISYAKAKGKTAFVNTAPPTRTMSNWNIQHITEDTGPAGITTTHLSTPLAWTYDIGELPGYQHIRESLNHGAISFARSGAWSDHMFPLTPIELRAGTIIGQERILTNHSGRFGWGDASGAEVLVYDGEGRVVEKPDIKEVKEGNKVFTEVRMPSDHFAILIRKPAPSAVSSSR